MSYTINIIPNRSTSGKVWSFHTSKFAILFFCFTIFAWPFVAYIIAYKIVAPQLIGTEVADMAAELHTLSEVKIENINIEKNNSKLTSLLEEERKYRAEAEARVAIVENARATASENLQKSENTIFELKNQLGFYNALMEKSADSTQLQCFNILLDKKGEKLKYKVNFMHDNVDNKQTKKYTVKFRIIGAGNLSLDKVERLPILHTRDIKLRKDVHLTGNIKINKVDDTLSILDIRAYDTSEKLVARCWKAF